MFFARVREFTVLVDRDAQFFTGIMRMGRPCYCLFFRMAWVPLSSSRSPEPDADPFPHGKDEIYCPDVSKRLLMGLMLN
jgi:hypothetical protein